MSKLNVLSSGSSGNSLLIEFKNSTCIIDVGTKKSTLAEFAHKIEEKPIYVFLTHEHHDHIFGLKYLNRLFDEDNIFLYASKKTLSLLENKSLLDEFVNIYDIDSNKRYDMVDFEITTMALSHDGVDPLGYRLDYDNSSFGIITDTGKVDQRLLDYFIGIEYLLLEANYDEDILHNSNYPYSLKKRISSYTGHLSNRQAMDILNRIDKSKLKKVLLGHISENTNDYELVNKCFQSYRDMYDIDIDVLKQKQVLKNIII